MAVNPFDKDGYSYSVVFSFFLDFHKMSDNSLITMTNGDSKNSKTNVTR